MNAARQKRGSMSPKAYGRWSPAIAAAGLALLLAGGTGMAMAQGMPAGGLDQSHEDELAHKHDGYYGALAPQNLDQAVALYHASPRDPVWEYVLSPLQAELCLDVQSARVCLIGHSHVALSFSRPEGGPATGQTRAAQEQLDLRTGEWLLNPGSVGQPRDGDPRAAWLELELDGWTAEYHRVEYDIAGAAAAIRAARLPESLADRLQYGQ